MPAATRLGDGSTGHGSWPPRNNIAASSNVYINGIGAHRQGDSWPTHCNPAPSCHAGSTASGSSTVFINGKQAARIGDPVDCGDTIAAGSSNVFIGG